MWTRKLLITKARALAIHLGLSLLIFLPFLYLIWFEWFPPPMFFTDGGWQGLRIMLLVDLVIGPSLTFLIYNPAKTRGQIRFDFGCIAIVQALALAYGCYSVESKRILAVAFSEGAFHANPKDVYADQLIEPGLWDSLGDGPIYWVYSRKPKTADEASGVTAYAMMGGVPRAALAFLYEPLAAHLADLKPHAIDLEQAAATSPARAEEYRRFRARHADAGITFYRLEGYFAPAIVALDAQGRPVGWLREATGGAGASATPK